MSAQKARELIGLMSTDAEFRETVVNATTRDSKHAVLEARGFGDVSPDDLLAVTPDGTHLSESELEAVAGGTSPTSVISAEIITVSVAIALAL